MKRSTSSLLPLTLASYRTAPGGFTKTCTSRPTTGVGAGPWRAVPGRTRIGCQVAMSPPAARAPDLQLAHPHGLLRSAASKAPDGPIPRTPAHRTARPPRNVAPASIPAPEPLAAGVPGSCAMRKADITADLVSRLVADQFPQWAGLPIRPVEADGIDNTTFRLGQTMSVRLPSAGVYVEQVDKEHRWLPVLARQLPLPIPEPLAKGVPGRGFPPPSSVYRRIDAAPATAEGIADMPRFASAPA